MREGSGSNLAALRLWRGGLNGGNFAAAGSFFRRLQETGVRSLSSCSKEDRISAGENGNEINLLENKKGQKGIRL